MPETETPARAAVTIAEMAVAFYAEARRLGTGRRDSLDLCGQFIRALLSQNKAEDHE